MLQLPLYDEVKQFFPYHRKELVKTFILFTQCVFQSRTVSLYKNRSEAGSATGKKTLIKESIYKSENSEDFNFKDLEKVQLMLAILAFLYVIIQKEHLLNAKTIKDKKFKHGSAKDISIFRNSYDNLKLKILNINYLWRFLRKIINSFLPFKPTSFDGCKHLNLKSVQ